MASRQKSGTSLGSGSGRSTPTSENSDEGSVQQKQTEDYPLPSINERLGSNHNLICVSRLCRLYTIRIVQSIQVIITTCLCTLV